MTDFVLSDKVKSALEYEESYKIIRSYANFLKQPLKLEMFVPCDEEGDILEVPTNYENRLLNMMTEYNDEVYTYNQAKEKVLFEGFKVRCGYLTYDDYVIYSLEILEHNNIESLTQHYVLESEEIQLTENAVKQIGL